MVPLFVVVGPAPNDGVEFADEGRLARASILPDDLFEFELVALGMRQFQKMGSIPEKVSYFSDIANPFALQRSLNDHRS